MDRDLADVDYVYVWADGIHLKVRLEEARACVLVLIGGRTDGSKELVALKDGYRESTESWADLMRDCARRGMRAPVLAVGDGALGFWNALAEVLPETREQRCWVHKTVNVLGSMPKTAQPGAKRPSRTSTTPRTVTTPRRRSRRSPSSTARSSPRPSKRSPRTSPSCWRSTTSRPSTGSTCAPRTPSSPPSPPSGCGPRSPAAPASRTAALSMVFKLVEAARQRWRAVNAPHLVALVRAGARFEGGQLVERPDDRLQAEAA